MTNGKPESRHWAQVLAEMPDAKKIEDRARLTFELLGSIGGLERQLAEMRSAQCPATVELHDDEATDPDPSAPDYNARARALGQAFDATLEWTKARIGQLVGRSPETLAETVARAATWLELLDEAMVMAGQGGFHGELFSLLQEAGQAHHGYKAQQPAVAEPDQPDDHQRLMALGRIVNSLLTDGPDDSTPACANHVASTLLVLLGIAGEFLDDDALDDLGRHHLAWMTRAELAE